MRKRVSVKNLKSRSPATATQIVNPRKDELGFMLEIHVLRDQGNGFCMLLGIGTKNLMIVVIIGRTPCVIKNCGRWRDVNGGIGEYSIVE